MAKVNDRQSLDSNHYPSGRFPKVSIGITVGKYPKLGSQTRKEDGGSSVPTAERVSLFQGKALEENRGPEIIANIEGKQVEGHDQKAEAWVSTRSARYETPTMQTVQFYANRTSVLQSEDGSHKKLNSVTYEKRKEKAGNTERVEEVAFATMQEMHVVDKGAGEKPDKMANCNTEVLKMKLWEILGTAPSQNKHVLNSPNVEENRTNSKIKQNSEYQRDKVANPKQHSDTIETDSESPNQTTRRPVTRSLTRKKGPAKTVPKSQQEIFSGKKPLSSSNSEPKLKLKENNIFTFDEGGQTGNSVWTANGHSSMSNRKRSDRMKAEIEPRKIVFPKRSVSDRSLQINEQEQASLIPEEAQQQSKATSRSYCQAKISVLQPSTSFPQGSRHSETVREKKFGEPLVAKNAKTHENIDSPLLKKNTCPLEQLKSLPIPKGTNLQENVLSPPSARNTDPVDDFHSPTLAMKTSPPLPKSKQWEESFNSPVPAQQSSRPRRFYSARSSLNSRPGSRGSDVLTESSDDTRDISEPCSRESVDVVEEKEVEEHLSPSLVEEQETESFKSGHAMSKGFRKTEKWFSDAGSPKKSPFTHRHNKRARILEDVKVSRINLPLPSPIGTSRTEETIGSHGASEHYPEHSLARAVAQLALVIERFKTKIKSQTSKKSSEILSSVSDKLRLQLQNVESQIQADVGKFTSLSKSKRKRLESRFQDQQERLKLIHDKFKEEVNQHLLDCRSTLEEVEANHMELKGSAERQKASHRKLLLHVEEAMEVQLSDAETSILGIRKEARKKMNGLKHVLKEWLREGEPS